jgi:hypothetical protein
MPELFWPRGLFLPVSVTVPRPLILCIKTVVCLQVENPSRSYVPQRHQPLHAYYVSLALVFSRHLQYPPLHAGIIV